ncbi:MAG: hypothetical protein AABW89_02595 [Nanoarchaeota archaeon]
MITIKSIEERLKNAIIANSVDCIETFKELAIRNSEQIRIKLSELSITKELHNKIMKEGKYVFEILENYDKTREWPLGKKRIDITLSRKLINKLRIIKEKTGKPLSQIIEDAVEKFV